jgi:hypothetical protein
MKIPLEKRDILAAYGASREAERSVDALLIGDWLDCQNYYDEERTAFFRQVIEKLQGMLGPGCKARRKWKPCVGACAGGGLTVGKNSRRGWPT